MNSTLPTHLQFASPPRRRVPTWLRGLARRSALAAGVVMFCGLVVWLVWQLPHESLTDGHGLPPMASPASTAPGV